MTQTPHSIDPRLASRERQPGLDLLRALAIVIVVFRHIGNFGFTLPGKIDRFGWIGVDLFFVLSGYLIGGQLASLAGGGKVDFRRFFARRALRILPAYLVVLAVYFSFPAWREFPPVGPLWKYLLSVQNLGLHYGTAFSHSWSLAVEDQFYLVLPWLLLLAGRWPRAGMMLPGAILLGGLALRAWIAVQHPAPNGVALPAYITLLYYPTWARLDPLVFGVTLAAIEQYRTVWWQRLTDSAPWLWLPGLAAMIYGLNLGGHDLTVATCVWQFPLIAFGMAALLICVVSPRMPFRRVAVPGAAFLASIAYSVYLSHKLIIHFVLQVCASRQLTLTSFPAILLVLTLIYLTGTALFFAVERPFLQLRHRLVR